MTFGDWILATMIVHRLASALFLLLVEIGGNIFHESRGQERLDVHEPEFPIAGGGQLQRLRQTLGHRRRVGEIDGQNDAVEH